jgi:6-phosphogluconolactonase
VSSGANPLGFALGKRDQFIGSEAAGGALDQGPVSSCQPGEDVNLAGSPSAGTTETAVSWQVVTNDVRFSCTANARPGWMRVIKAWRTPEQEFNW